MKKIAFFTGGRWEYGLLKPVMEKAASMPEVQAAVCEKLAEDKEMCKTIDDGKMIASYFSSELREAAKVLRKKVK